MYSAAWKHAENLRTHSEIVNKYLQYEKTKEILVRTIEEYYIVTK